MGRINVAVVAQYLFFLCVAVTARYFGVGPSLLSTIVSTVVLWEIVFPSGTFPCTSIWFARPSS